MRVQLFGAESESLHDLVAQAPPLERCDEDPDVIICYGGDGTLLTAEQKWPGVPKAPIRNSRRGNRCIGHPPEKVIARLATETLVRTSFMKLRCTVRHADRPDPAFELTAMNEINVHMGRINSAVRFSLWVDEEPFAGGREILGDGFVVSTPFGSTAYFSHITRGIFHAGIGVAFQNTTEHTNHIIVPEAVTIRVVVTRGPAMLAYDNAESFFPIREGHELVAQRHPEPAIVLTWGPMSHPSDAF